jgi:lipopolysaccharide/colanic/teichoic acid biosynthesis glycosyltransferase
MNALTGGAAVREPVPASHGHDVGIRLCDIAISLVAIVFFAPLLIVLAAAVFVSDPGPIFFGHKRIGRDGQTFRCFKFRSMVIDADKRLSEILASDPVARNEWQLAHKLSNDPRITTIGSLLRRSSLDELPQLFNVLRGEMSLVGPRPIVVDEAWRYGRYLQHYLATKPGVTGLWQVSGRSNTTYRRRVALDVAWCRSRSIPLYWKIMIRTIPAVLLANGSA